MEGLEQEGEPSSSSYSLFAHALSQCRGQATTTLLDTNDGLALQFADVCSERAEAAADEAGAGAGLGTGSLLRRIQQHSTEGIATGFLEGYEEDDEDALAWRLEEQTWRLVHALHAERIQRSAAGNTAPSTFASSSSETLYQTPFAAVQDLIESNAALAELKVRVCIAGNKKTCLLWLTLWWPCIHPCVKIVRDWLSSNLACLYPVEVRKGYWPFTKNRLRSERRMSTGPASAQRGPSATAKGRAFGAGQSGSAATAVGKGVKSLDPDSVTREASTLELEDAAYEKALSRTLFEYARGGQLDAAIDLARQADRHWRAASLRGANLYWRPGLSEDVEELTAPMGNRNRALWKAVCRAICVKSPVDEYERALYGALSGDLKSVLAVSTTWESYLWAHTNARLEASIDASLDKTGSWWSQEARSSFGTNAKDLGSVQLTELPLPKLAAAAGNGAAAAFDNEAPLASELRDVFVKLAQTEQHGVQ